MIALNTCLAVKECIVLRAGALLFYRVILSAACTLHTISSSGIPVGGKFTGHTLIPIEFGFVGRAVDAMFRI